MKRCVLCTSASNSVLFVFNKEKVVRCNKCGLVRTEGKLEIDYKSYHRDEDYQIFEKMFKNIFSKRFKIIRKYIKSGKVLDIGASTGTFLKIFKEDGWEAWGVEPSKSGEIAKKKGIKIVAADFEKSELPTNYFDLVILNHTLEHVTNPVAVLTKVKSVLKKDGIVFIDVPNFGGLSARIFGKYWRFLTPNEHIFHFTEKSLKKVIEAAGFKVLHQESRSGLFEFGNPLAELWDALITFKKRFFSDLVTLPYSLIATYLNMGNSMSMIGKK